MDKLEIIETLKELKLEIEIIKEKQKKMIKKMNVLIKKTNNMCFVYNSSDSNSSDIFYNSDYD
jgi:hypothetical protein